MASTETTEPLVGKPCELSRYSLEDGERVLVGQRVDGVVRITDRPLGHPGRTYLVEEGISSMGELAALIADYKAEARRRGGPPMRVGAIDPGESDLLREALS